MYPEQKRPLTIIKIVYAALICIYVGLLISGIIIENRKCERNHNDHP
jgi:hypothetical protein